MPTATAIAAPQPAAEAALVAGSMCEVSFLTEAEAETFGLLLVEAVTVILPSAATLARPPAPTVPSPMREVTVLVSTMMIRLPPMSKSLLGT